jgi:hypothetical protein
VRLDFENGDYYFGMMKGQFYHGQGSYFTKATGETLTTTW